MHDTPPTLEIETALWLWRPDPPAKGSWHFVTITGDAADAIRALAFERRALGGARGFGSVRLRASVQGVAFETSAFPHKQSGGYVLPVKAAVRKRAGVEAGDGVTLGLWV